MAHQRELRRRRRAAHRGANRGAHHAAHHPPPSAAPAAQPGTELEVKLQVPDEAWDGVAQAMQAPDSRELPLHAVYLDTADRRLAAAGIGLRVRREGGRWMQTLKARGTGWLDRLEDEMEIAAEEGEVPAPDLSRHADAMVEDLVRRALGLAPLAPFPALEAVFEVRVLRRVRRLSQGESVVELALDEGVIEAGGRKLAVRELELELLQGRAEDLLLLARRWRERHGLWLGWASKAARGHRLALGEPFAPAATAVDVRWERGDTLGRFTAEVLAACLAQVAANAAEIAAGSLDDDHVHQLRVGLRRLRTALRELPLARPERGRCEPALVRAFRALGERRDRTHVLRRIQPLVEAAGGPELQLPPGFHEGEDPAAVVRDGAFQDALLGLMVVTERLRPAGGGPVRRATRPALGRLARQVLRDGRRFERLDDARQHRVRKRLKRLRYLGEFLAPLYPAKRVQRYVARLKPVQQALGDYNDEAMARQLYEELAGEDPGARFAAQWLASRHQRLALECRKALRKLQDARPFWEK
jgi:inorganic triphosphatase YgiF